MLTTLPRSPLSRFRCLSAEQLKLLAIALMLCDHLWATLLPAQEWMTAIGRLAFPIFAFQVAEGAVQTHDRAAYRKRMFLFALLSEIPYDLVVGGSWFYPFHQNVLFTFWLSLFFLDWLDRVGKATLWGIVLMVAAYLVGSLTMVDYYGIGIVTVLLFYLCRDMTYGWLVELVGLWYLNTEVLGGYGYDLTLFGRPFFFCQQSLAVLALIPIWLYNGRSGENSKVVRKVGYWFYPVHLLVLYGLWQVLS